MKQKQYLGSNIDYEKFNLSIPLRCDDVCNENNDTKVEKKKEKNRKSIRQNKCYNILKSFEEEKNVTLKK